MADSLRGSLMGPASPFTGMFKRKAVEHRWHRNSQRSCGGVEKKKSGEGVATVDPTE